MSKKRIIPTVPPKYRLKLNEGVDIKPINMNLFQKFIIRLLLTVCIYTILTLPYITFAFFNFGIDYGRYGCIVAGFITVILAPFIQEKLKLN